MNNHNEGSAERGPNDLGWLIRCRAGCEGIVHDSVPCIGDPCPLCTSEHTDKPCITYCVKTTVSEDAYQQMSMEGGISFEGDMVQAWDIDLGSFLASVDSEDRNTIQGDETEGACRSAGLATETGDDKEGNSPEDPRVEERNVGDRRKNGVNVQLMAAQLSEYEPPDQDSEHSIERPTVPDGIRFSKWHVLGLICCTTLLLIGGLLTFDIVRALYSPNDMTIASPILRVLR